MIGRAFAQGSFTRRIVTRGVVVLGAVLVGGQVMRTLPHDQTLIFPVGSVYPSATRFSASWKQRGDSEPRGGVTLTFEQVTGPPLQIRQHARLPNGDYIVTVDIAQGRVAQRNAETHPETGSRSDGLQTNIERRVTLSGGETVIGLAASTSGSE